MAAPAPAPAVPDDIARRSISVRSEAAMDDAWTAHADWIHAVRLAIDGRWERELEQTLLWRDLVQPTYSTGLDVAVDPSGAVREVALARSSGVTALDEAVVRAARAASPLPAPPPEVAAGKATVALPPLTFSVDVSGP